jgi:hypothetical protein
MPYFVNGTLVPEQAISQEEQRIGRDIRWQTVPDPGESPP